MSNGKPARAVILAAGMGTRLRPLTAELPKPMVPVCGRPIITTSLDGLRRAKISDVYVICGWQKKKLFALKATYPEVQFLENPDFATANNISSILVAGELLQDALVIEGDLYFHHPAFFSGSGQFRTISLFLCLLLMTGASSRMTSIASHAWPSAVTESRAGRWSAARTGRRRMGGDSSRMPAKSTMRRGAMRVTGARLHSMPISVNMISACVLVKQTTLSRLTRSMSSMHWKGN